jgi:hypothetical protein
MGLEDAATMVRNFDLSRLPGLLQTPEYTRNMVRDLRPPGELTAQWIEDTVASREQRQKRLETGELQLHAIVDEAVLSRRMGDDEVMREQIQRLIDNSSKSNVTLQVIPFDRGPHPGMEGSFQYMTFADQRMDDVVYVEGLLGNSLLDKRAEVSRYLIVFDDLSTRFALDQRASRAWLRSRA